MPASGRSRILSTLLAGSHLLLGSLLLPTVALAQQIDIDPPVIEFERVNEGIQGETQVFTATVTDNVEVTSVVLHFRSGDDGTYVARDMEGIDGTDIYSASVESDEAQGEVLQYYLEARDGGGNRTIQGFAFDPIERVLVAPLAATDTPEAGPDDAAEPGMSTTRKVVYGALGLLVVGAIAAAASSDDSSDDSSGPAGPDIPLTITVPPLQ